MKICDIVQFFSPLSGGVKRYITDKARFLSERDDVTHVAIVPSDRDALQTHYRSRIYEVGSFRLIGSQSYRMLLSRKQIEHILDMEKPDIIEVGDPYRSAWIAADYAERHNLRLVAYYHSDYPRALSRTVRRFGGRLAEDFCSRHIGSYLINLYSRMDATVVASHRLENILGDLGIPNLVRIPLGTDTDVFYPRESRERVFHELGIPNEGHMLLYAGRLAREKNIRAMIGTLDELPRELDCRLIIIGDGEQRRLVEQQSALRDDLVWLPYCGTPDRLAELYSAADLFVHTGTCETFGLTSLESQSCGARVIAIRGGGVDETLEGESPIIMAESPEPASIAKAIKSALVLKENDVDRKKRSRRIAKHFSGRSCYTSLVKLYHDLLEQSCPETAIEEKCDAFQHSAIHA